MTYTINLIKNTDYKPTYWSGGIASELITYPLNSSFANRDFLWRIGCAKIDIDTSIFSSLPSIKRHLMVTDGEMILTHKEKYSKLLKNFDQDFFMGDWNTSTKGRCSVLNLMTQKNYDGTLTHINILKNNIANLKYIYPKDSELIAICIHSLKKDIISEINSQEFKVEQGDLLCVNISNPNVLPEIKLKLDNNADSSDIVVCIVFKNN
ncbi:HutD family protein [Clostridium butyricum]|uniref:HutD family protein n=1 Tax=Clostridium butyricum TaxID=1492 RepID=UPI0003D62A30|nr:HutD family protein [Clostridium butyricum]ETI88314.1 MAG: hypothetical protein Q607_CBUC00205G0119 [Clostridium butyricum DORA_1]MDU1509990.1 HutD family protein [Clostridium butyricum]RQN02562.1 HutD-family protein [Clostridium butyricum]